MVAKIVNLLRAINNFLPEDTGEDKRDYIELALAGFIF